MVRLGHGVVYEGIQAFLKQLEMKLNSTTPLQALLFCTAS